MDKVTRLSTNHNLFEEKGRRAKAVSNRGPSAYHPNALPLGQTGWREWKKTHYTGPWKNYMCGVEGRRGVCGMSRRKPVSDHQTFRTFFSEVTGRGGGGSAPLGGRRKEWGGGGGSAPLGGRRRKGGGCRHRWEGLSGQCQCGAGRSVTQYRALLAVQASRRWRNVVSARYKTRAD